MFAPLAHRLHQWRLRHIARRKLALLDDRLLADIGTSRRDIGAFVSTRNEASCAD